MPQAVIASEAKQSLRLLRHCVPRNDTFLWTFTITSISHFILFCHRYPTASIQSISVVSQ
jgi:hypothetical protein